jgi:hypothetical protein
MVQLNATKRTATKISQFTKKYDFYVPGERALLREKKKRLPTYHVDRYIVTIYVQDTVVCPKNVVTNKHYSLPYHQNGHHTTVTPQFTVDR